MNCQLSKCKNKAVGYYNRVHVCNYCWEKLKLRNEIKLADLEKIKKIRKKLK